ncbi:MAG: hypothetical protein CVV24_08780 [Ignavibacteriae bacterium HGW-Ignavibacteriae-3]|nr:MAG: hypothetical protein CVV24_08780 [Ignavibacteriae bacterium HGW-Ignavibacteriae-3]
MKSENENGFNSSRRKFIQKTSAAALGLSVLGSIPSTLRGAVFNNPSKKSKVVLVRNSKVIDLNGLVNNSILSEMLQAGLTNFSGDKSFSSYISGLFSPSDIIGLKINTLGLAGIAGSALTSHFTSVTSSLINIFNESGLKDSNFIIWDRSDDELISAGYSIQKEKDKTRIMSCAGKRGEDIGIGYSDEEYPVGNISTKISRFITDLCTVFINIPVLKDHGNAGFTGALKNHYGSINNPREFHNNNCTNPGIPEVNLLSPIRTKQKLIVGDLMMGVFNGGPRWDRKYIWPYGGIIVGTDPVAVDTIMLSIINEKRKSENINPLSEYVTRHINLSAQLGLGTNNLDEIDLVKIDL